jgi:hypothetical protein
MPRPEIRDSQINQLLEKAENRNYKQYLPKLVLRRVRGFEDEPISFDFPVTALIGVNGGGKTTILGAAACAYLSVSPRRFFAKSGKYDESMQDWSIEYEIVDKDRDPRESFHRTASFKNYRWNRDAIERPVLIFGVSRTVPANERSELSRCATGSFEVPEESIVDFPEIVSKNVSRILGKDVSGFRSIYVEDSGRVTLLTGSTYDGHQYSEFHFGAGESSVIRMVFEIEAAPEQSLILIEEIENGLHPVATQKMVEYLIDIALRKKMQVIFTTHSDSALQPLPHKAIWVAENNKAFQGKLSIRSLRAITGDVDASIIVFVEDAFAKSWLEGVLRFADDLESGQVEVHAMAGDGTAVAINRHHNQDPTAPAPSICFIDGDSRQQESEPERIFRLPGEIPETYIFDSVLEASDVLAGKLAVALHSRFEQGEAIIELCRKIRRETHDPHLLYAKLGEAIGLIPEMTVVGAFCSLWAQNNPEEVQKILHPIMQVVRETRDATPARTA